MNAFCLFYCVAELYESTEESCFLLLSSTYLILLCPLIITGSCWDQPYSDFKSSFYRINQNFYSQAFQISWPSGHTTFPVLLPCCDTTELPQAAKCSFSLNQFLFSCQYRGAAQNWEFPIIICGHISLQIHLFQ